MTALGRGLGAGAVAAGLAALVWASNAPMVVRRSADAQLRLGWSALPERIEVCRELSHEELARVPAHMRQPVICEGTTAEYRLQVRRDDALVVDRLVQGGGMRRDRRLYVFEEVPVPAGESTIDVRFERVGAGPPGSGSPSEIPAQQERPTARAGGDTVPARLRLERRVRFASREVILVTFDSDRRELVAIQGERR